LTALPAHWLSTSDLNLLLLLRSSIVFDLDQSTAYTSLFFPVCTMSGSDEREKKTTVDPVQSGKRSGEEEKKQPPSAGGSAAALGDDEKAPEKKKDVVSAIRRGVSGLCRRRIE